MFSNVHLPCLYLYLHATTLSSIIRMCVGLFLFSFFSNHDTKKDRTNKPSCETSRASHPPSLQTTLSLHCHQTHHHQDPAGRDHDRSEHCQERWRSVAWWWWRWGGGRCRCDRARASARGCSPTRRPLVLVVEGALVVLFVVWTQRWTAESVLRGHLRTYKRVTKSSTINTMISRNKRRLKSSSCM